MKPFLTFLFFCLTAVVSAQESRFHIKGTIGGLKEGTTVYYGYKRDDQRLLDSVVAGKGTFAIKGTIDKGEYLFATIVIDHEKKGVEWIQTAKGGMDMLKLLLIEGSIAVSGKDSVYNSQVQDGLNINKEYKRYQQLVADADAKDKASIKAVNGNNRFEPSERSKALESFVQRYPASLISIEALKLYAFNFPSYQQLHALFAQLAPTVKSSKAGKAFAAFIETTKSVVVGQQAPDFVQNDSSGNAVQLSSFKGKYVLLDFWASWCGPCREANPLLVALYKQYKDKNFAIVGVSLDKDKSAWTKAIAMDGLTWTQVSDLKHWNNAVAALYGIQYVPQNILIDPYGKIIAKDVQHQDLLQQLQMLLQ